MPDNDALAALNLSPQERGALRRALGAPDDTALAVRIDLLQEQALKELVNWLVGRVRFASLAEMDTSRILHLYLDIRGEVPTVETMVNDVGMSVGRATSVLGRLRYWEARSLRALVLKQTHDEVTKQLATAKDEGGRKSIWVKPEIFDIVFEAASAIMLQPKEHGPGKKWVGAEMPTGTRSRFGQPITATTQMWTYILGEITASSE